MIYEVIIFYLFFLNYVIKRFKKIKFLFFNEFGAYINCINYSQEVIMQNFIFFLETQVRCQYIIIIGIFTIMYTRPVLNF